MIRKVKPEYACSGCAERNCTPTGEVVLTGYGWMCTACDNCGHWLDDMLEPLPLTVSSAPDTKPCPFCNSTEQGVVKGPEANVCRLICHDCGAGGPPLIISLSNEQAALVVAVRNWNRRDGNPCAQGCMINKALRDFANSTDED